MISVAICTYNGENYIGEQLYSIINQTVLPDEIILCDDGSKDATVELAKKILGMTSIKYKIIINKENLGFVKNFEKAILNTHGDIIFLSDQDDRWLENKIETILPYFDYDGILLVHHNCILTDGELQTQRSSYWDCVNIDVNRFNHHQYDSLFSSNCVQGSACAFRRELFEMAVPFPDMSYHDEWLALVAMCKGDMYAVSTPLMQYRQWGNNTIGAGKTGYKERMFKYLFNFKIQLKEHVKELERRADIFSLLIDRGFTSNNTLMPLSYIHDLLEERFQFIKHNKITTPVKGYFQIFGFRIGSRQLCKDILSRIILK